MTVSCRSLNGLRLFLSLLFLLFLTACSQGHDPAAQESEGPASSMEQSLVALTGDQTRIVWLRDMSPEGRDFLAWSNELRLMGLDTAVHDGERVILETGRNMVKPMFTASGEWIIFSDREHQRVHAVSWDGLELVDLGPGFGLTTWVDRQTGTEWLYVARNRIEDARTLRAYQGIYRYPLFAADSSGPPPAYGNQTEEALELVWNQTQVSEDSFQISADGRFASAAFPWPEVGSLDLDTKRWFRVGRGCWVAMSPDENHLLWVLDGPHRNVRMYHVAGVENWYLNINNPPGVDGYEVYHPRWSNHPRIIAVTGPYKVGEGANKLGGGGAAVKVHVGRLNDQRTEVESWVTVTDDGFPDFYPDVWVRPDVHGRTDPRRTDHTPPSASSLKSDVWPVEPDQLVYVWENAGGLHDLVDDQSGSQYIFRPEPRQLARYDRHHAMLLDGGFFFDADAARHFQRHQPLDRFSVEFLVKPTPDDPSDGLIWAASLMTSNDASDAELGLAFAQDEGIWRLLTADNDFYLGPITVREPTHVVLSSVPGKMAVFFNGRLQVEFETDLDLSFWSNATLFFGGTGEQGRDWHGVLEHFAVYARALEPEEVAANHALIAAKVADRPIPEQIRVRARIVQTSAVPSPEDIAPYRRGLVVNEYEVMEVLEGELPDERFLAAHWAILDATVLERAHRLAGTEYELVLERFEDRQELEGERVSQDTDNFLLELYFDENL